MLKHKGDCMAGDGHAVFIFFEEVLGKPRVLWWESLYGEKSVLFAHCPPVDITRSVIEAYANFDYFFA